MKKILMTLPLLLSSAMAATIIPFERDLPREEEYMYLLSHNRDSRHFQSLFGGDKNDQLYSYGFSIHNSGPNEIVPTIPEQLEHPSREYTFITDDNSRRGTYIWMTDYNGSGYVSDYGETILVFLPRQNLFHVEEQDETLEVTLTTGEEVTFFKKYKTLDGGVLTEGPVDLNPRRDQRRFAQLNYSGSGIILRSDAWGNDPRFTKELKVIKKGLTDCSIASNLFWTREDFPKFKFVRDEDAYSVIAKHCGTEYLPDI